MQLNKKFLLGIGGSVGLVIVGGVLFYQSSQAEQAGSIPTSSLSPSITSASQIDLNALQSQGFWYDEPKKLLWYKCHIDETFSQNQCIGEAKHYTFTEAERKIAELNTKKWQGIQTWRLPEIQELHGLVYCSTGFLDKTHLNQKLHFDHGCAPEQYQRPTIDLIKFTSSKNEWYWSATAHQGASAGAAKTVWGAYFSTGYIYDLNIEQKGHVYVVSSLQ